MKNPKRFTAFNKSVKEEFRNGNTLAKLDGTVGGHIKNKTLVKKGILANLWNNFKLRHESEAPAVTPSSKLNSQVGSFKPTSSYG